MSELGSATSFFPEITELFVYVFVSAFQLLSVYGSFLLFGVNESPLSSLNSIFPLVSFVISNSVAVTSAPIATVQERSIPTTAPMVIFLPLFLFPLFTAFIIFSIIFPSPKYSFIILLNIAFSVEISLIYMF